MSKTNSPLHILLISQWPNVKNAEYELIEKIKQIQYKVSVVDYLGFDVDTNEYLNTSLLMDKYSFAIAFHYDTPKLLNIPTYLWVANPLEFMHLRDDYCDSIFHNLRAYDDFLYNDSELLKCHIKDIVGKEWQDSGLNFYASGSEAAICKSVPVKEHIINKNKIFYCGINWERIIDVSGRIHGLLDILQEKQIADFYGPEKLGDINPWKGFSSYRGEIPFDGISMSKIMRQYSAVLAISSPAHIRSCTSSSRVFEGLMSGVPVISDENYHVKQMFGDLVYYFNGDNVEERALSISTLLKEIIANPEKARIKVCNAQNLIRAKYTFEQSFLNILKITQSTNIPSKLFANKVIDICLLLHDPYQPLSKKVHDFNDNILHILKAASEAINLLGIRVRLVYEAGSINFDFDSIKLPVGIEVMEVKSEIAPEKCVSKELLGEKVARLVDSSDADFITFFTQFDYPHYDYFIKSLLWFSSLDDTKSSNSIYVAGSYIYNVGKNVNQNTDGMIISNKSISMYKWSKNSMSEHQLGTMVFGRNSVRNMNFRQLGKLDVIFSVAILMFSVVKNMVIHRSRFILIRIQFNYFKRHYDAYKNILSAGFWPQHYELVSNYNHELNMLYNIFHESESVVGIIDKISGRIAYITHVDPAVYMVNQFLSKLRPLYRVIRKIKRFISFGR